MTHCHPPAPHPALPGLPISDASRRVRDWSAIDLVTQVKHSASGMRNFCGQFAVKFTLTGDALPPAPCPCLPRAVPPAPGAVPLPRVPCDAVSGRVRVGGPLPPMHRGRRAPRVPCLPPAPAPRVPAPCPAASCRPLPHAHVGQGVNGYVTHITSRGGHETIMCTGARSQRPLKTSTPNSVKPPFSQNLGSTKPHKPAKSGQHKTP